jgi:acetyl esterase/lipase
MPRTVQPDIIGCNLPDSDYPNSAVDATLIAYACCRACGLPAGGGFIIGSCHFLLNTVAATAAAAGLTIICPEYCLAPEHPFPTGLNDILTTYKSLITTEGYRPRNLAFVGDSAGGNLVAAAAIQLRREGVALPGALGMLSPAADATNKGDTVVTLNAVDPVLPGKDPAKGDTPDFTIALYIGNNTSELQNPLVSPVIVDYASLFTGGTLPPTLIQVGLREILLSDAVRLYHKMKEAAPAPGHVVLSPYEGMWHVWQGYVNVPEAIAAQKELADFLARALNGQVCK